MSPERTILIDYVLPDRRHSQGVKKAPLSSYTLALLLAQTPRELMGCRVTARVHDEQARGPYDPEKAQPDILCITYLTTGAPRAYDLSDRALRSTSQSGEPIKVVHGGVHATSLPREALLHAHVAVRGEVTPEFQQRILERALEMDNGDREIMRVPTPPDVISRPPADWSWMRRKDYILAPVIQTSVGCPFHCDFCSVTEVFGAAMRAVSEESLRRELSTLSNRILLPIIDDNFLQGVQPRHIDHCIRVAAILHEMGFRWVTEVTVRTLIDAQKKLATERPGFDLIRYFAEHGCRGFFFGIETIDEDGAGLSKSRCATETVELIRRCHANGLGVLGAFVIGVGANETADSAKRLLDFAVEEARVDFAQFSINTPMPGARNFLTGIRDGTVFDFDWERYDAEHCVMHHPRMSPSAMEETHRWLYNSFYSYRNIRRRFDLLPLLTLSPSVWRRFAIGVPVNLLLHNTNRSWNNRLDAAAPHEVVPEPHPLVTEHVNHALGPDPIRPGDLFNVRKQDDLDVALRT